MEHQPSSGLNVRRALSHPRTLRVAPFITSLALAALAFTGSGCAATHLAPCTFFGGPEGTEEVLECATSTSTQPLSVRPEVLAKLTFYPQSELAAIWSEGSWSYVNRQGEVAVSGVPTFDNGPDPFVDGLTRFQRNGKFGYANFDGSIVVPPTYEGALPFQGGYARVCSGCKLRVTPADQEHHTFEGGSWSCIATDGRKVAATHCSQ